MKPFQKPAYVQSISDKLRASKRIKLLIRPFLFFNVIGILLFLSVAVVPIIYVVYLSLVDLRFSFTAGEYVGLANYIFIFEDPSTTTALLNTLYFSTLSVFIATSFGLGIALLVDSDAPFTPLLIGAAVLPWALPEIVNALMWQWVFDSNWGVLNALLVGLGITDRYIPFFSTGTSATNAVIFAYSWKLVPFVVLIFYAALRAIPITLYESAQMDGANAPQIFRYITLPLLMPALAVAVLFCLIFSMRAFDLVYLLTRGGPGESTVLLSYYTFSKSFEFGDFSAGAAVSVILAVITLVMTLVYWWVMGLSKSEQ